MRDTFSHLPDPSCGGVDHTVHRRKFLQGVAGVGAFSLMSWGGLFSLPAFAEQTKRAQAQVLLITEGGESGWWGFDDETEQAAQFLKRLQKLFPESIPKAG